MIKHDQLTEEEAAIGQVAANIIDVPMDNFLHNNYHPYAYYVIRNRALVGTDGLKPVQRRILYSMFVSKILPNSPFVKASKVAANVMGDYHPHGNVSIEDALARVAQTFSMRIPLVEPYGSVGYFTGDKPAAPRYWESRLTPAALELLVDLKENALPMSKNYSNTLPEPTLLPVKWPNILINGTEGIAVGYASKCYPHNPTEVMDAAIALVKNPNLTIDELLEIMPGPDFPTGGELIEVDPLKENYLNGNGSFIVRGRYKTHKLTRNRTQVVFYELPYQVSAETIISEINKLQNPEKKEGKNGKKDKPKKKPEFTEVAKAKDLSDSKRGLQLSITLKTGTNSDLFIQKLFQKTSASKRFSMNTTVLEHGTPSQVTIFDLFEQFIDLRKRCVTQSLSTRLDRLVASLSNLNGLIKVLVDLDKTIEIIRNAETEFEAQNKLMSHFGIEESQADYILSLQLRRLTQSDRLELKNKAIKTQEEIDRLNTILSDKDEFNNYLIAQLEETKKIIADDRRTLINNKTTEEILAEEKQAKLELKAQSKNAKFKLALYADGSVMKQLETDSSEATESKMPILYEMEASSNEQLYAVLEDGTARKFPSNYIPINNQVKRDSIGLDYDFLTIGKHASHKSEVGLLLTTNLGKIALVNGKYPTSNDEFTLLSLDDNEKIVSAEWIDETNKDKNVFIGTSAGFATAFPISSLRVSNPGIRPIKAISLTENAHVVGVSIIDEEGTILSVTPNTIKTTDISEFPIRSRGTKGVTIQRLNKKSGEVISMYAAKDNELIATDILGNQIVLPPKNARAASGLNFGGTVGLIFGKHK